MIFAGCEKPEPEQPEEPGQEQPAPEVGKITLESDEELVFSDSGESHEVSFEATLDWTAAASEDFVTVKPTSGKAGEAKVTVTIGANESYDPRTATLTLTCGEDQKTIQITQKQKGALLLTQSDIYVAAEGGKVTVVAKANTNVTATVPDAAKNWITEVKTKGLVDYSFDFEVAANESEHPRVGQIVFTNESGSETITIQQAGAEPKETVFAASFATGSELKWANGDKINVNGVESAALVLEAPAASAEYTVEQVLAAPYKAVYPASALKAAETVTIAQSYAAGEPAWKTLPMAAYSAEAKTLEFAPLFSAVKVIVNKAAERAYTNVAYVEFAGLNNEQVTGDFTVDFANKTLTGASNAGKTIRYNVNAELGAEALNVYVVLPAGTYSKGYVIKVADSQGNIVEVTETALTLTAGQVYDVPAFEYAAPAPETPAVPEITSAAELIAFIANYNNGDAPATAVIKNDFAFSDEENAAFQSINSLTTVIDGNNCTISNFNSGKPLAVATVAGSEIKNLTIAGTTEVVLSDETSLTLGTFAGTLAGNMTTCTNKVAYTVSGTATQDIVFGTLAGNVEAGAVIDGAKSEAQLNFTAGTTANAYIGVIAGKSAGTIQNANVLAVSDSEATVLFASTAAKTSWLGGVVALNAEGGVVNNCTNNAALTTNLVRNSDANRYCHFAGIVAENAGKVANCTNNAALSHLSCEKTRWVASIVGENKAVAEVENCVNNGNITVGTSSEGKGGRYNNIGGLIADNKSESVSNVVNNGSVTVDAIENNGSTTLLLGGCFGTTVALSGNNKTANNGAVTFNSKGWASTGGLHMGGVAGTISGTVTNVKNTGAVIMNGTEGEGNKFFMGGIAGKVDSKTEITVSGSNNTAEVNFNVTGATRAYSNICVGGIIGYSPTAALTVRECDNSGLVKTGLATTNNPSNKYIGGIVGFLEGKSLVENCDMTGSLNNNDWNNSTDISTGAAGGGIVGRSLGTEEAYLTIKGCNVLPGENSSTLAARRGWLGGVVGYAKWTHIESCTVKQPSVASCSYYFYGGICGQMVAATASDCVVEASTKSSQTKYAGGLVGRINGESSLTGCTFKGDVASTKTGDIMGLLAGNISAAGAQIKNCKYKGTINGAASTVLIGSKAEDAVTENNTELSE